MATKNMSEKTLENRTNEKNTWYSIEKDMFSSKVAYFMVYAKESCNWPFMIMFLKSIGLTTSQAGLVNGVRYIGSIIGCPIWGSIADTKRIHKAIMILVTVCSILLFSLQLIVPIAVCTEKETGINTTNHVAKTNNYGNEKVVLFYLMMALSLLTALFDGSISGFIDATVLRKIKMSTHNPSFGVQRSFGAIGYGVIAFVCGMLLDASVALKPPYSSAPIFILYALSLAILLSAYLFLPQNHPSVRRNDDNVSKLLRQNLLQTEVVFLFAVMLVQGTGVGIYASLQPLLLKQLNGSSTMIGISVINASISSLFFFLASSRVVKRIGNIWNNFAVSLLANFLRMLLYYASTNVWIIVMSDLLFQGVCYTLPLAAYMVYINDNFPDCILTSVCSIASMVYIYASMCMANVIGGYLTQRYGIQEMFLYSSLFFLIWCLVVIAYAFAKKLKVNSKRKNVLITQEARTVDEICDVSESVTNKDIIAIDEKVELLDLPDTVEDSCDAALQDDATLQDGAPLQNESKSKCEEEEYLIIDVENIPCI